MGIPAIGHACEHTCIHAHSLNPFMRGFLIVSDAKSLLRYGCAPMRSKRSGHVSWSLTVLGRAQSNASRSVCQNRASLSTNTQNREIITTTMRNSR